MLRTHVLALVALLATSAAALSADVPDENRREHDLPGQRVYKKGMGTHAPSLLVYEIKPEYRRFVATVGLDDEEEGDARATVQFEVLADATRLFTSDVVRLGQSRHVDVELPKGAKRIRLVATDAGDGISCDHANWANAGFVTGK